MYQILPNLATCSCFESNTPEGWIIVDVRDLGDNGTNFVKDVKDKIRLIGNLMCSGYKVVVRCDAGMSRSNTIACAAMIWCGVYQYWDDTWKIIQQVCPRAMLNLDFFDTIKKALIELNVNESRLSP